MADANALKNALLKVAESSRPEEVIAQADEVPVIEEKILAAASEEAAPTPDVVAEAPVQQPAVIQPPVAVQRPAVPQIPIVQAPVVQTVPAIPEVQPMPQLPNQFALQGKDATTVAKYMGLPPIQPEQAEEEVPQKEVEQAAKPSPELVKKKVDEALAPVRDAKAADQAQKKVLDDRLQEQRRQEQLDTEVAQKMAEIDNRVRVKSLPEIMQSGSFGQKLGAIIAIALGGFSQAYSGAKTNPVIDFMNQAAEQQAAKDKLGLEEKQMLKRQLLEQAELRLKELEQKSNDEYRKGQIALQRQQLSAERQTIQAKLEANTKQQAAQNSKFSGYALTPEQEATLTMEERRNAVTLPDGRRVLTQSYEDANEYKKNSIEIYNAIKALEELQTLGKSGSKFSLKDRARANSLIVKVVGALRLPYTGPGVLTDNERQILIDTLGNPLAFFSFRNVEMAKLGQVRDDLLANLQNHATYRGIKEQVTPEKFYNIDGKAIKESELVQSYRQKMPGMSEDQIKAAIRKSLPGL